MEFDPAEPVTGAVLENTFKMGQVLQIQKKYDQALEKYLYVCNSMLPILRQHPEAEYSLLIVTISKLVEIYREKDELDKAIAFMKVERELLETLAARKGTYKDDDDDVKEFKAQEHDMTSMMDHMESALHLKTDKKSPEEIVQMLMEARKKQERENQEKNMQDLLKMLEERQKKYENSRWERFTDWLSDNPVFVVIGSVAILAIFIVGLFVHIGLRENRPPVFGNNPTSRRTGSFKSESGKSFDDLKKETEKMQQAFSQYRELLEREKKKKEKQHSEEL